MKVSFFGKDVDSGAPLFPPGGGGCQAVWVSQVQIDHRETLNWLKFKILCISFFKICDTIHNRMSNFIQLGFTAMTTN